MKVKGKLKQLRGLIDREFKAGPNTEDGKGRTISVPITLGSHTTVQEELNRRGGNEPSFRKVRNQGVHGAHYDFTLEWY